MDHQRSPSMFGFGVQTTEFPPATQKCDVAVGTSPSLGTPNFVPVGIDGESLVFGKPTIRDTEITPLRDVCLDPGGSMLGTAPVTTILPVIDAERAQDFYERTLGLSYAGQSGDGKHLFAIASGTLALLNKPPGSQAEHTVLSFEVPDAADAVHELSQRGVKFEDYDFPGLKTVNKVCILGSEKAAWFKDTEGNILCVHQVLADGSA